MDENTITTVFRADISQFSSSAQQLNTYIKTVNSEFEVATSEMGKWSDSTDGLTAKITQLNKVLDAEKAKLEAMKKRLADMEAAGKGNTKEAQNLQIAINKQTATVKKTEKQTNDYTKALKELEDAGVKTKQELKELTDAQEKQGSSAGGVAGKIVKGLGAGMAAVGAAAVGAGAAVFNMAKDVSASGDVIDKESQKMGISAEKYQQLSYAMERSGADVNDFRKGMKTITKELSDVENGVDGAGESFSQLGISMRNSDGSMKSSEQILLDSVDALAKMENQTQRNALAQQIFGRSADELNPLLNSGSEGIKEMMQEAKDYGMIMSDDAVAASATFQDSLTRLQGTMSGLKNNLMGQLLPGLTGITEGFTDMIAGVEGGEEKMREGVDNLVSSLSTMIPKAIEIISTIGMSVLESAPTILKSLSEGIMDAIPQLIPVAVEVIEQLITTMVELVPQYASYIGDIVNALADALESSLPTLIPLIIDGIISLAMAIIDNLDTVIDAGIKIVMALADGLIEALPKLLDKMPMLIDKVVNAITNNLPKLIKAGVELTLKLAEGLIKAIPDLVASIPQIISSIVTGFTEALPDIVEIGKDIVKGIWDGIKSMGKWIKDKVTGFLDDMLGKAKDFLGINSPSKLFRDKIGKGIAEGIGVGFEDEMDHVANDMQKSLDHMTNNLDIDNSGIIGFENGSSVPSWVDQLINLIRNQSVVNNYKFDYKFEGMESSRLALHKAQLETKRIIGG
ncbi:MAG: phage tail tape measure protein [Bacillus sp. (in: Bacteria)]|nr:phage tail tape measure protein [Bacillus sp. (in: firmicutes)]